MKIYFPQISLDNKNFRDFLNYPNSNNEMKNINNQKKNSLLNNNSISKKSINQYLVDLEEKNIIYSENGIFQMFDDKITKINIVDSNTHNDKIIINNNSVSLLLDKSSIYNNEEIYQIPLTYKMYKIIVKTYKLREKSQNRLIVELHKMNDEYKIIDFYIDTTEKSLTHSLNEDIISFLMVLNFYK